MTRFARTTLGAAVASALASGVLVGPPAQALDGTAESASSYTFTAKLAIGDTFRSCTGTLVDPLWVLTASSCFAADLTTGVTATGAPKWRTTATIGRTDLTSTAGQVREVVELVPRADRDLVLARLAAPVRGIAPLGVGVTAPAVNDQLKGAAYGRTKDTWVPDTLRAGSFEVGQVDATSLLIDGTSVCKGDTGAPVFREQDGRLELAAVVNASWQGGCLGTPATETRTAATAARVDDARDWILSTIDAAQSDSMITASPTAKVVHLSLAGADGVLHTTDANYGTGKWADSWTKLDGRDLTALTSVTVDNVVHMYAVGTNGRVYGKDADYNTGTFSEWGEVPGGATGVRALSASVTGKVVHLQMIGSDGALHTTDANYGTGKWADSWTRIDAKPIKAITSTVVDNIVHIYGVGTDNKIYGIDANYNTGKWSDTWSPVPGGITA
ncbi:trypsin-like serine protease [Streptomyces acidiscabies]|uniref:trypsin-like serine protease n=1 Tax=Streptomyces acidiscabies TaxID=42234 RepID=UPI0009529240|nr:trypsin-like serine protease [Streptomyces acidiscabies]